MNPYQFLLDHGHWLEHSVEASTLLGITIVTIIVITITVGGTMRTETDYTIKNPKVVFTQLFILLIMFMIVSHFAVRCSGVKLWIHNYIHILKLRDQWDNEHPNSPNK
jgi:amino acid permease